MGTKLDTMIANLRKHPHYARFNGQMLREIAVDKLKREDRGPCYCQQWSSCRRCKGYMQRFKDNKAAGLWEGPGYRPPTLNKPI